MNSSGSHRAASAGLHMLLVSLCLAASWVRGDIAQTYTDSGRSELRQGVAVQHFVVPYGCVGTAFEFYCDASQTRGIPDHEIALQVYSADRKHLKTTSVKLRNLPSRRGWLKLDGLALPHGTYYAQLFSNSKALSPHLHARLFSSSDYRGGHAATGWKGGTPLGARHDFQARLTFAPPPPRQAVPLTVADGFLVKDAKPCRAIVLAADSTPGEWTAAEELRDHVREISGAELPISLAPYCSYQQVVAVGFDNRLPPPLRRAAFGKLDDQELVIKPAGNTLLLAGGTPQATLYAVYEFLHRLGVRWYSPEYTKTPKTRDIAIPPETICYSPPVTGRTLNAGNQATRAWLARNRLTTIAHWGALGHRYGTTEREGPDMHTVYRLVPKAIFKEHPDWLCMVDGKRVSPVNQNTWDLCYGNPAVRKYFVDRTISWARQHPEVKTVWIGQNDSPMYCTCEQCQQFYAAHGGKASSVIVQLVNELADAFVRHGMVDRRAKTLAYGWSAEPPKGMVLRDNAIVCVCKSDSVAAWRTVASNIDVYIYGSHSDYWSPTPSIYIKAQELKQTWQDGATELFRAISGYGNTRGSDLVHLRAWLTARLLWDPSSDTQALIEDFCQGYYGPAAGAVLESIRLRHERFTDGGKQQRHTSQVVPSFVDPPTVRQINQLLGKAYDSVPAGPYRKHLGMARIPYLWTDFWLGYQKLGAYDPATSSWSVAMQDGEIRNQYGKLAKQFMVENDVNALGERKVIDPNDLALEKMGIAWPAPRLVSGSTEAVVVPAVGGLLAQFRDTKRNFAPLKPCFGGLMLRYPLFSATEDNVAGKQVTEYELVAATADTVTMRSKRDACEIEKTLSLTDGTLRIGLSVTPRGKDAKIPLLSAVMFDLLDHSLGIHPTLHVRKTDGTWQKRVLGVETDFWWVEDKIPLDDATGEIVIASATRPEGIRLTVDPKQLARLHFWYSKKQGYYPHPDHPDPAQHGILRLFLEAPTTEQTKAQLAYSLQLLPDAKAAVNRPPK